MGHTESEKPQNVGDSAPNHPSPNEVSTTIPETQVSEQLNARPKHKAGLGTYLRIFTFCDRLDIFLYAIGLLSSIASGAALPLMTIVFGQFTSDFTGYASQTEGERDPQAFRDNVDSFTLYFIYLFVGRFVLAYLATQTVSIAAVRVTRSIRKTFLSTVLRQEVGRFDDHTENGSISAQVTSNGIRINQGIAEKLVILVQAVSLFISAFIVALIIQWKLALITSCIIPAILILAVIGMTIDIRFEQRIVRIHSQAAVLAQQVLSSIKTAHAFWAQEKLINQYDKYLGDVEAIGRKKSPNIGIMNSIFYFCMYGGTALAFWQGFRMYASGEIRTVGTVITVILSLNIGASSMALIAPQLGVITNAAAAAAELIDILDRESSVDPLSTEGEQPPSCEGNIEIRNLEFAYPSRPTIQVLRGLNMSIPAGKTTALVGASGCGKSTIVGLLERWYLPGAGDITLDGRNIAEYNIKWLRSRIRIVQQEPVLFRGSVFENVAKGFVGSQLDLPREQQLELVKNACKLSNAHEFVENLPQGYDSQVGERASMLSGGQKQRLVIARSVVSNPQILLLDEATSALDPRNEGIVQDALNKVSVGKTTLIIAHKLSTVQSADHIVVMSQGQVVEQGTHHDLLAQDGQYAALVRAQDLGHVSEKTAGDDFEGEDADEQIDTSGEMPEKTPGPRTDSIASEVLATKVPTYSWARCLFIMQREHKDLYFSFCLLFFACVVAGGSYPAQAIIYSRLIDVFTLPISEARSAANFFALIFFVFSLINMFAYLCIGWIGNLVGQRIARRYRLEMFQRYLNLDLDFFDQPENASGALTSKLLSIPNALQDMLATSQFVIFVCFTNILSSSVVAIAFGWKLGLVVVFAGMPILIGSGMIRSWIETKLERDTSERFADTAALATEAVSSIRTLASLTLETQICDEYNASLDHIARSAISSITKASLGYAISQSLDFLLMALGFWYGSRLLASGEYTVSQYFVTFLSVIFGGQAASQIFGLLAGLATSQIAANYMFWLRELKASIQENDANKDKGPPEDGTLSVNNVVFRYKQRESFPVLNGISMTIPHGSYIACVGPSGCGKSTLIALLERFYDPTSGTITLGPPSSPVPIPTLSPRLYRAYMSLVAQHPTLYDGSVRDNIALGLSTPPSAAQLESACRLAAVHDFVASLPQGLDTPCGAEGLQFSGGQRQRIAVARALIRKPRLLLLDEATSALDTQSERVVQGALDAAAREERRTTVAVAHRLSTIRHADVILVFEGGRVVERGGHEELVRRRGRYWKMCLAQGLDQ